ncbi:MAG: hypothetical protein JOZ81_32645 [Chloroflexi bacterium]|nr:hypothetical protein [Chloroflexota bacterium]
MEGGNALTDGFGRPIDLIEGFVVKGQVTGGISIEAFVQAHEYLESPFRIFWDSESDAVPAASTPMSVGIGSPDSARAVHLDKLAPYQMGSNWPTKPRQGAWRHAQSVTVPWQGGIAELKFSSGGALLGALSTRADQIAFYSAGVQQLGWLGHMPLRNRTGVGGFAFDPETPNRVVVTDVSQLPYENPRARVTWCLTDGMTLRRRRPSDGIDAEFTSIDTANGVVACGTAKGSLCVCRESSFLGLPPRWSVERGAHTSAVRAVTLTRSGTLLASLGARGDDATVWQLNPKWAGLGVHSVLKTRRSTEITCLVFCNADRSIACGTHDGTVDIWSAGTGELDRVLGRHRAGVTALAATRNGSLVVSASADGTVTVWDQDSWQLDTNVRVTSLAVREDGSAVACGDNLGQIHLWVQTAGV